MAVNHPSRITHALPLHDRWLRVRFTDGAVVDVDLAPMFQRGGVFRALGDDAALFAQVRVDPLFGTVVWPGDVDLDPDVLYGRFEPAGGAGLERHVVIAPPHGGPTG